MSTFNSTISLNQQEFDSLTRVDKVVWNNNSFTCLIPATTPPPTTTTTPPPSTTPTPCVYPDPPIYDPPKLEDYYNGEDIAPYDPYLPSRPAAYAQQKAARKEALEAAARPMSDSEMETYLNNRVNGHGIYGGGIVIEGANMVYVLYDKERDFTYKLIEYDSQYSFLWVAWEAASEAAAEACAGTTIPPTTSSTSPPSSTTTPPPTSTTIGHPGPAPTLEYIEPPNPDGGYSVVKDRSDCPPGIIAHELAEYTYDTVQTSTLEYNMRQEAITNYFYFTAAESRLYVNNSTPDDNTVIPCNIGPDFSVSWVELPGNTEPKSYKGIYSWSGNLTNTSARIAKGIEIAQILQNHADAVHAATASYDAALAAWTAAMNAYNAANP